MHCRVCVELAVFELSSASQKPSLDYPANAKMPKRYLVFIVEIKYLLSIHSALKLT